MRQTQRKRYQRDKNRINAQNKRNAKTASNSTREKVNTLKMIRAVLTYVLLVGLERKIKMPQESITLKKRKDTKYSNRAY
jgi:hypothetical protein